MNFKISFVLFLFIINTPLCFGQLHCPEDIYVRIGTIAAAFNPSFPNEPAWLTGTAGCDYDEPLFETDRWRTNGNYSITKLVKTEHYNDGSFMNEFFWIVGGFAGRYFCIDDNNRSDLSSNGQLMQFDDINVCWPMNGVWFNFCTQCEDCNASATPARGRWWKYRRMFSVNELDPFDSPSTPLVTLVSYMNLADCSFETDYGCDDDEEDGQG